MFGLTEDLCSTQSRLNMSTNSPYGKTSQFNWLGQLMSTRITWPYHYNIVNYI